MLTLPPYCNHKLQPLDLTVFGSLKAYYKSAVDSFLMRNPCVPMTVYQVAECTGEAHIRALTPAYIMEGLQCPNTQRSRFVNIWCNGPPTKNCKPS
jgi:hypothetical protein